MKQFLSVHDVRDVGSLLESAARHKAEGSRQPSRGLSLCAIFLNPSLRTRLSTIRACENLGVSPTVLNIGTEGWSLELETGVRMDGNKPEHIAEAAAVIGSYYDVLAIRTFAGLQDREADYAETWLRAFVQHCGKPVISLESATLHPLQSLADALTVQELKTVSRPKVVCTWAPHVKPLPQAVANSFLQWMKVQEVDLVLTHPEGYALAHEFADEVTTETDQKVAFEGADFIYAKNWSSFEHYGQMPKVADDWTVTAAKMARTRDAKFLHCLPVRRNVVVADEVLDSSSSAVIHQANNRIWAAQAVLDAIVKEHYG